MKNNKQHPKIQRARFPNQYRYTVALKFWAQAIGNLLGRSLHPPPRLKNWSSKDVSKINEMFLSFLILYNNTQGIFRRNKK